MSITDDLLELLPLYALGVLDDDEARAIERAVALDPALRVELDRWQATAARLGATLATVAPTAAVRARLLDSVDAGVGAARFAPAVAELFDVDVARAAALLGQLDDAAAWTTMAPGIRMLGVRPGPAHPAAQCALLRVAAGARFPWHRHLGEEIALVVHGGATMADGRAVGPGDQIVVGADGDDAHDFVADPAAPGDDDECVFAVRGHGIRILPRPA